MATAAAATAAAAAATPPPAAAALSRVNCLFSSKNRGSRLDDEGEDEEKEVVVHVESFKFVECFAAAAAAVAAAAAAAVMTFASERVVGMMRFGLMAQKFGQSVESLAAIITIVFSGCGSH